MEYGVQINIKSIVETYSAVNIKSIVKINSGNNVDSALNDSIASVSINFKLSDTTIIDSENSVWTRDANVIFKGCVGVDQHKIGRCIAQGDVAINGQITLSINVSVRGSNDKLTRVDI